MPSECDCFEEITRLHHFFQDWFRGDLDPVDFKICEDALAPGFAMVTPSGDLVSRDEILEAIWRHRSRESKRFSIETVGRGCEQLNGVHLVTYEERQGGVRSTIRLSTAALAETDGRFVWHRVHETGVTV